MPFNETDTTHIMQRLQFYWSPWCYYLKAKIDYKNKNFVSDYRTTACSITGVAVSDHAQKIKAGHSSEVL